MPELAGRQPDAVIACVGGGSNAMGIFYPFIPHAEVQAGRRRGGRPGLETGKHAASLTAGRPGVLHGNRTYLLQDENGQIIETHSISAGLDYPGRRPRARLAQGFAAAPSTSPSPTTRRSQAFHDLCRFEGHHSGAGIEPCAGLCGASWRRRWPKDKILLVNLSGRGDKDMHTVAEKSGIKF